MWGMETICFNIFVEKGRVITFDLFQSRLSLKFAIYLLYVLTLECMLTSIIACQSSIFPLLFGSVYIPIMVSLMSYSMYTCG